MRILCIYTYIRIYYIYTYIYMQYVYKMHIYNTYMFMFIRTCYIYILIQACAALVNMVAHNADNQEAIAAQGGICAIMSAMRAHTGHAGVQEKGCWALLRYDSVSRSPFWCIIGLFLMYDRSLLAYERSLIGC
jgi:hypothetical protein